MHSNLKALGDAVIESVRRSIDSATAAIWVRVNVLDERIKAIPAGPKGDKGLDGARGEDGKDAPPADIDAIVKDILTKIPTPKDGRDGTPGMAGKDADPVFIERKIREAVDALPKARDGTSVTLSDIAPLIQSQISEAIKAIPTPKNGADADSALIEMAVRAAVDDLPKPSDGKSVDLADVRPMVTELVRAAVDALPVARNGIDSDPAEVLRLIDAAVARLPKPADGKSFTVEDIAPDIDKKINAGFSELSKALPKIDDVAEIEKTIGELKSLMKDALEKMPIVSTDGILQIGDIRPVIELEIKRAIADIPAPKDGAPGRDGASISVGDGAPLFHGAPGEVYLDKKTGDLYKCD